MEKVVEVCAGSYLDVVNAYRAGAQRVELNSGLYLGGLTPSLGALVLAKQQTNMKIITMVRPRSGGFCYQEEEFETMKYDVMSMLAHGADGIAFGCLDAYGNFDVQKNKELISLIKKAGKEVVFHRAIDCSANMYELMEACIAYGVDRVLTSGGKATAMEGKETLKNLYKTYGNKIEILAGSGLHAGNVCEFMSYTGIQQIHASCKGWAYDPTTSSEHVSFAYAGENHRDAYDIVSEELVHNLLHCVHVS